MASVGRRLTLSACNGQRVGPGGEFEDFCDILVGDFDTMRATRALRRKYHDPTIVINNVEKTNAYYKMDALEFIAHAERIVNND